MVKPTLNTIMHAKKGAIVNISCYLEQIPKFNVYLQNNDETLVLLGESRPAAPEAAWHTVHTEFNVVFNTQKYYSYKVIAIDV